MAFYNNQEEYEKFLIKHNLTDNQFAYLWSLTNKKNNENKFAKVYERFNSLMYLKVEDRDKLLKGQIKLNKKPDSSWLTNQDIKHLEEAGYLIKVIDKSFFPDTHDVAEKFYKDLFIESNIAFEELYELFPKNMVEVNGVKYNRMNVDMDEARQLYKKKIGNSLPKHQLIMAELENQIKHKLITVGFDKWLKGEMWLMNSLNSKEPKINKDFRVSL